MSDPGLHDQDSPDVDDFVTCWMQPVMRSALERVTDDEFPFALVTLIDATDDPDCGTEDDIVQIDYLDVARDGLEAVQAVKETAKLGHRRMMELARKQCSVTLSDGSVANADYVETTMKHIPQPYPNDRVRRRVARYKVGLSFVAVT